MLCSVCVLRVIFSWPQDHSPSSWSILPHRDLLLPLSFPTQSHVQSSSFACAVTGSILLLFSQRLLGNIFYSAQVSTMPVSSLQPDLGAQNSASVYKEHMTNPNTTPHPGKHIRRSSPIEAILSFLQDTRKIRNIDRTRSGLIQALSSCTPLYLTSVEHAGSAAGVC